MKKLSRLLMAVVIALTFSAANSALAMRIGGSGDCRGWVWGPMGGWQCVPGALDCDC